MATPLSGILQAESDNFKGAVIKPQHYENFSKEEFRQKLSDSLVAWKSEGRKGVWLSIPLMRSELISVAAELGFKFHHSKPDMVTMTTWLSEDECTLPIYATHNIGVAGFVVNDKNEVLLVQEKWQRDIKLVHWKLPGGVAEPGEDLWKTAIRETFEETGIRAEFVALFAFRHMHGYKWGTDDIYFICLLRPLDTEPNPNLSEIAAVKWMDIEEYSTDPNTFPTNRRVAKTYLESVKRGTMIKPTVHPHFFPQKPPISLYCISECDTKQLCDLTMRKWSEVEESNIDKAVEALSKPKM